MLDLNLSNVLVVLFYVLPFLVMAHKPSMKKLILAVFRSNMRNGGSMSPVILVTVVTSLGLQVLTFVANWPLALSLTVFSMGITPLFSNMHKITHAEIIEEIEASYK